MTNRRFEMHEYRHVIVRMRLGESDRAIAQTGLMGRKKVKSVRDLASSRGWLDPGNDLPDDTELVANFPTTAPRPQATSLVEPHAAEVKKWWGQSIQGTTIHQALIRKYGFVGSYSSVRRYLQSVDAAHPQMTTVLEFEPGDVAQVDFGAGPLITDVHTGEVFKTWVFVMVLAWSRHQYAELVRDQKVETWLVLGEVVGVHIMETLIEDGVYQTTRAEPVMRGGGPADYFGISEANRFQIFRPK